MCDVCTARSVTAAELRAAIREEIETGLMAQCRLLCSRRPACLTVADAESAVDAIMPVAMDWCAGQCAHIVTPRPGPLTGKGAV